MKSWCCWNWLGYGRRSIKIIEREERTVRLVCVSSARNVRRTTYAFSVCALAGISGDGDWLKLVQSR